MKPVPLVLAASLAVNAACVAFYLTQVRAPSAPGTALRPVASHGASAHAGPTDATSAAGSAGGFAQLRTQLESGDLKSLVDSLRAAGFSPRTIRTLISIRISEQFNERRKAITGDPAERPFWKNAESPYLDPAKSAALRELGREQANLLKSLLGTDDDANTWMRRQYGNLAPEKFAQLQSINSDYNDLIQDIYAKSNGFMLPEDRQKLAFLEKEKQADLARALTPEEMEEFQLRSSPAANQVRGQLGAFDVTEAEFRALYKLQTEFDAQHPRDRTATPESMSARAEAEKQLKAAFLATLSPERAADYKLASDPAYRQVNGLVTRLELPPATTREVIAIQQDILARTAAVRSDPALSSETRKSQLLALQQEASAKLSSSLTPRGFEAYKESGIGRWFQTTGNSPSASSPRPLPTLGR